MITIQVSAIQAARKLLTRIHFERLKLPVLNHALATVDAAGLTLAVTDLDHWLETRLPATFDRTLSGSARFLIPAAALAAAASGDKGSTVQFECPSTPDPNRTLLKLTVTCGGMPVQTVYQPDSAADFPVRPTVKGQITTVPKETLRALQTVAVCASTDTTRSVLNGVLFLADATVPETQRLALISRLRSLDGKGNSVRLTWDKPGHLTLTLRDSDATAARIDAPVVTTGQPPVIAFGPAYLADALAIGSTLRLIDGLSPGMAVDPSSGNFCVLMPCRCVAEDAPEAAVGNASAPAVAA